MLSLPVLSCYFGWGRASLAGWSLLGWAVGLGGFDSGWVGLGEARRWCDRWACGTEEGVYALAKNNIVRMCWYDRRMRVELG